MDYVRSLGPFPPYGSCTDDTIQDAVYALSGMKFIADMQLQCDETQVYQITCI